jgi:hypothetical protein
VIEPRNVYSRGQEDIPQRGESRRFASAGRQQSWTRYGECRGHHRGLRAGHAAIGVTRELGRATCLLEHIPGVGDRVTKGPGVVGGFHSTMSPLGTPQTHGSRQGIGKASDKRSPRKGQRAVVAAQSTGEGGEVWPKRPTGGKAPSGRASAGGGRQGRDIELTNPDNSTPVDCMRAAAALLEEPYACIAHVRVCGGAGWVTTGSTRQLTPYSLRSAPAFGRS